MEIGKRIKQLRIQKGVTQEALANELGVTAQAISRWENGTTMPDIIMLPKLAVQFGISIDDLFEYTEQSQYERIQNMLNEKQFICDTEFNTAKSFLEKQLHTDERNINAVKLLARLYFHRAKSSADSASIYAKKALMLGDTSKSMNNILRDTHGSPHSDWNMRNRHELISFYYEYIKTYPDNLRAYRYMIPALVADGRTAEATSIIENIKGKEMPELVYLFNATVFRREGKNKELKETLNKLKADYNESWHAWSILADFCADECNYDEAIKCYEKSFELQAKPRYSDPLESVAHIYEITGQYEKAASTYKRIIELLAEDWNISFGATIDRYNQKIYELTK